tara:strand:- start:1273 stop:1452 length:180 start_codon:yes stop_codon:yes gene_type:complete
MYTNGANDMELQPDMHPIYIKEYKPSKWWSEKLHRRWYLSSMEAEVLTAILLVPFEIDK